jgi:hypothetical protein
VARYLYGGTAADVTTTQAGQLVTGAVLTAWDAQTGGSQITDLQDSTGAASTVVTSDAYGRVLFYAPDGENRALWLQGSGPRMLVRPAVSIMPSDSMGVFNVKDYGATGDGTADDTAAIQAAITAATAAYGQVLFPVVESGYKVTSPIEVSGRCDVVMHSPIIYAGSANTTALTINPSGSVSGDVAIRRTYEIRVSQSTQADWTNEGSIGVVLRNLNTCNVTIAQASGFTIGAMLLGDAGGFAYNNLVLGHLNNGKVGLDLNSRTGGWTNENIFIGGRLGCDSGVNTALTRYGVRIRSEDGYVQNANVFHKPSFELDSALTGGAEAVPILITHGMRNRFSDIRDETYAGALIRTTGSSTENFVSTTEGGYLGYVGVDDQGTRHGTILKPLRYVWEDSSTREVFSVTDIAKRACFYDTDWVSIPGMVIGSSSNAIQWRALTGFTITDNYVETDRSVGIMVDVREVKRFLLEWSAEVGYRGRPVIRCYDGSMTLLDPALASPDLVVSTNGGGAFHDTTGFGGAYITGVDSNWPQGMHFSDDVSYAWISITSGTTNLRISSFRLTTPELHTPAVWTPFPDNGRPMAASAPTQGTHWVGRIVDNETPTVGQPKGWVCTVAGTPGTWVSLGNL